MVKDVASTVVLNTEQPLLHLETVVVPAEQDSVDDELMPVLEMLLVCESPVLDICVELDR